MPSDKRFIFGLGCGGCGTVSLAKLFNTQPDTAITHEGTPPLPWLAEPMLLAARLAAWRATPQPVVGDVAFYLLPYVPMIWKRVPDARFICLRRDRTACLQSLVIKMRRTRSNLYQHHDGRHWSMPGTATVQFPKYDHAPSMEHAIARYYDDYYHQAAWFADERPEHFRIFPLEALNTEEGVVGMLDFAGYPRSAQHVAVGIRENASPERSADPDLRA